MLIQKTHAELVAIAAKWLSKKCPVVVTELVTTGEEPDAIGWQDNRSVLVECKAQRADFLRDKGKTFRRFPASGIGRERYFLVNPGVAVVGELPEGWGMLEVGGRGGVSVVRKSDWFYACNQRQEIRILTSVVRRIGRESPEGISIRCYTFKTKNKATLGVERKRRAVG